MYNVHYTYMTDERDIYDFLWEHIFDVCLIKIYISYHIDERHTWFSWKHNIFVFITLIELLLYTDGHIMSKEMIAIKLIMKFEFFLELIVLIGLSSYLLVKAGYLVWAKIKAQWLKSKDLDEWIL